jgi:hypothetical protein
MRSAPKTLYKTDDTLLNVLPALRDIFSRYPVATTYGVETLATLLYGPHFPCSTEISEIEVALEALAVEGEVLA